MTDAEKLRRALDVLEALVLRAHAGTDDDIAWREASEDIERIASLLDAVPPETLRALKEGTWVAVPKKPTVSMDDAAWKAYNSPIWSYAMLYRAMLAAAPMKPEG